MYHERPNSSQTYAIVLPVPDLQSRLARDPFLILGMENTHPADVGRIVVHIEGECPPESIMTFSVAGSAGHKVAIFRLWGAHWIYIEGKGEWTIPCGTELQDDQTFGLVSRAFVGEGGWDGEFVLTASIQDSHGHRLASDTIIFHTAPFVLASALDRVESVLVVDNTHSASLVAALRSTLTPLGVNLETVRVDDGFENDVWMQDAVEIGRVCVPSRGGIRQPVAILSGIRAKHEGPVICGPLDRAVRGLLQQQHALVADMAEPRAGKDCIDWFGNLEVSPPVIARSPVLSSWRSTGWSPVHTDASDHHGFLEAHRCSGPR